MPIVNVLDTPFHFVVQQCACCGLVHTIPLASIQLGVEHDTNMIAMPACECGAIEFLNRTFDVGPEHLAEHRKKVNAIAVALKSRGLIHPAVKEQVQKETKVPGQVGDLVGPVGKVPGMPEPIFPEGLKLP